MEKFVIGKYLFLLVFSIPLLCVCYDVDCSLYECPPFAALQEDDVLSTLRSCYDKARRLPVLQATCGWAELPRPEIVGTTCDMIYSHSISRVSLDEQINITTFLGFTLFKSSVHLLQKFTNTKFDNAAYDQIDRVKDLCHFAVIGIKRGLFYDSPLTLSEDALSPSFGRFYLDQLSYLVEKAEKGLLITDFASPLHHLRSDQALYSYLCQLRDEFEAFMRDIFQPTFDASNIRSGLQYAEVRFRHNLEFAKLVPKFFNKVVYMRPHPAATNPLMQSPVINPKHTSDTSLEDANTVYSQNKVLVIDDFLQPAALSELQAYFQESTIWFEPKKRYAGAYWSEGMHHPLLLKLARELRQYHFISENPFLAQNWAYSYHNFHEEEGIGLHADGAVVNVNIWLTDDSSNLENNIKTSESNERDTGSINIPTAHGGMVIYRKPRLGNETFQQMQSEEFGKAYLEGSEHDNITVPYRCNRIVIFPSDMWHASGISNFKKGHANRRINLTFLFGVLEVNEDHFAAVE